MLIIELNCTSISIIPTVYYPFGRFRGLFVTLTDFAILFESALASHRFFRLPQFPQRRPNKAMARGKNKK